MTLTDESSEFALAGDPEAHILPFRTFTSSHEGLYHRVRLSEMNREAAPLVDMPALFEVASGTWLAITEADLKDYPGMYLFEGPLHDGGTSSHLVPATRGPRCSKCAPKTRSLPWCVLTIADVQAG